MSEPVSTPKSRAGKVAAVVSVLMILATIVVVVAVVISVRNSAPIEIESIAESVGDDDGCRWLLTIELRNNSDEDLRIERIGAILNRGRKNGMLEQAPVLPPGESGTFVVAFRLPSQGDCPSVDDINHGNLVFHLEDGGSQSVRF